MKIMTNLFTPREFIKVVEEESGKKIKLHEVSFEEFDKAAAIPGLHELWAKYVFFSSQTPLSLPTSPNFSLGSSDSMSECFPKIIAKRIISQILSLARAILQLPPFKSRYGAHETHLPASKNVEGVGESKTEYPRSAVIWSYATIHRCDTLRNTARLVPYRLI